MPMFLCKNQGDDDSEARAFVAHCDRHAAENFAAQADQRAAEQNPDRIVMTRPADGGEWDRWGIWIHSVPEYEARPLRPSRQR